MDITEVAKPCKFDDRTTSDVIVRLRNCEGRPDKFYTHSNILINKSKFFADQLTCFKSGACIEIHCSNSNYDYHVNLLRLLYLPSDLLLESLVSVKSAVEILQLAVQFDCEELTKVCVQYLEAIPWEDKEEEIILKAVSKLGQVAMPILARIQPVDLRATKNVFVSAVRFATSIGGPGPPFVDNLKTSAQEQVEYMLTKDAETPLVTADDEVKSVMKMGLSQICSSFEKGLSSLLLEPDLTSGTLEDKIMHGVSDVEWISNILPKMDLMKDFVSSWAEISSKILVVVEDKKLDSSMWGLKTKAKIAKDMATLHKEDEASFRLKIKETDFPYKMDEELCENIEAAIVQLILALPSNHQADILADWLKTEQVKYPDLSEAFEVWCYRTKSAKRRLLEGSLDRVGSGVERLPQPLVASYLIPSNP
ncbi:hypothetical protein CUMW_043790 [Citrus unshiu]|nr:hypothetical protein CUMW_043790 [Citrus unshiu]